MTAPIRCLFGLRAWIALLFSAVVLAACTPIIAGYSLQAYTNATSLKAETIALIAVSGEDYAAHAAEARALQTRLDAAYEFARGTAYNREAIEMWATIRDPADTALLGAFFKRWRTTGRTSETYRGFKKRFVGLAFDRLICLEANKKQKTACPPLTPAEPEEAEQ